MAEHITPSNSMVDEAQMAQHLGQMTGEDILQRAMQTIDSKLVATSVQQHTPIARFHAPSTATVPVAQASVAATPAPNANVTPTPVAAPPQAKKTVLTMQQFMAGLTKGNIRLASPTATTSDKKQLPIAQILKMAQAQSSRTKKALVKGRDKTKTIVETKPSISPVKTRRKEETSQIQNSSKESKAKSSAPKQPQTVGIEYTELTEPPEGYMCVFMPIKQTPGDIKPILVPGNTDKGLIARLRVTAQVPTPPLETVQNFAEEKAKSAAEEEPVHIAKKVVEPTSAVPHALYCVACRVYYNVAESESHANCFRQTRRRNVTSTSTPSEENDAGEDMDDEDRDANYVVEIDDDDDEDDDYKPTSSSTTKRRTRGDAKMPAVDKTLCKICNKTFKGTDHECSQKAKAKAEAAAAKAAKAQVKPEPIPRAKSPENKEPPKCSVCSKPYTSYDEHIACSGARRQNEKNQKDGQMRSVEIQRVKRRRRVHRFLRLNFTLNPQIEDPPDREFVGSHLVKDEDDLLEEHFTGGDEKPPLGLTCYVCSSPFEDDISAYHHYTQSKCGPKYIGKVLFRSKNRAENRPNNIMVEKSEQGDRPKLGQRLKRNYYNAFKEKIVTEDGTAKKDHICTACGESFANQEAVKEHYSREHRWRCKLCGDIYVHMKGVQLHYNRSHGKSYCVLCHVLFDSASELQVHMRTHQKRLCDLCGQVLANKHHYNKHMLKQHNVANAEPLHNQIVKTKPQPRGLCEICGKEYSWPFLKTKHMASHFNPKPPKPKKPKEEEEEGELEEDPNKRNKNPLYPFRCGICSRGFQRVFYFNQHLERHAKGLACQKCGLYFAPTVDRQKHLAECMDNICAECGEQCPTKEALKRHKQTHPGHEVCKICNREFATKFLLKNHAQTHRQYLCKVCGKRFPSMDHVNKHKCFGKKFQCKICGEKFSSIKQSKNHAKMQHNRDGMDVFTKKRVEFDMPDEEFVLSASMTLPMRVPQSTNSTLAASIPPLPGPSQMAVPPIAPPQPSMTAHEVSQALMTLHDFPMTGYSPMPLNMAREGGQGMIRDNGQRDPNNVAVSAGGQVQMCRDGNYKMAATSSGFRAPPNHPPPGYPGYF